MRVQCSHVPCAVFILKCHFGFSWGSCYCRARRSTTWCVGSGSGPLHKHLSYNRIGRKSISWEVRRLPPNQNESHRRESERHKTWVKYSRHTRSNNNIIFSQTIAIKCQKWQESHSIRMISGGDGMDFYENVRFSLHQAGAWMALQSCHSILRHKWKIYHSNSNNRHWIKST